MNVEQIVIGSIAGFAFVTYGLSEIRAALAMRVIRSQSENIKELCACIDKLCAFIERDAHVESSFLTDQAARQFHDMTNAATSSDKGATL